MSVIKLDHVSYVYSKGTPFEKVAVNDVNVEIEKGEFVGVIGHTGSGKSTLVQHLNALLQPTSGKVYIDGEDMWADPKQVRKFRFKVGLVFQYPEYQLFEETIYKDVAFGPTNMGLSEQEVDERVRHATAMVGIDPADLEKSPFELSGGQKRRVAIAGVMAMRPEVLVLDEPTAGLDPMGREHDPGPDPGISPGDRQHHSAGIPQHGGYRQLCGQGTGDERRFPLYVRRCGEGVLPSEGDR